MQQWYKIHTNNDNVNKEEKKKQKTEKDTEDQN